MYCKKETKRNHPPYVECEGDDATSEGFPSVWMQLGPCYEERSCCVVVGLRRQDKRIINLVSKMLLYLFETPNLQIITS